MLSPPAGPDDQDITIAWKPLSGITATFATTPYGRPFCATACPYPCCPSLTHEPEHARRGNGPQPSYG